MIDMNAYPAVLATLRWKPTSIASRPVADSKAMTRGAVWVRPYT